MPHFGVAITALLAGGTQRDAVQDRHVVSDERGLADHNAGGVIEHHSLADGHRRMDVDRQRERRLGREPVCGVVPPLPPQAVRNAVRLQGLKPLEVQQRVQARAARRVRVVTATRSASTDRNTP